MPAATFRAAKTTAIGGAAALALFAGLLTGAPAEAKPTRPTVHDIPADTDCPAPLPVSSVTAGMTGEGLTVVRGATPQPFAVEVLGVLEDGISADRDMIIIEVSDLPGRQVISAGGGIWSGMSGSPVYINGKLLGAVAYGFSPGASPIGGVTPAADMLDLNGRPGDRRATAKPAKVSMSAAQRRAIAARADASIPAGSLEPLTLPMSVSGLTSTRLKRFRAEAKAADLPVVAYAAPRPTGLVDVTALTRPQAGGNLAAALSYGDVTAASIGTTTAICGDEAVGFGHPFLRNGASTYGANNGNSLAIVRDDANGSFKLASVGAQYGTVDQDRLAGIRADLTRVPALTPIKSTISSRDNTKRRRGTTLATDQGLLPRLTVFGLLANYDAVFDEIGDGVASTSWTITGRRAGNVPFTISRSNTVASRSDIAVDAAVDPGNTVAALQANDFEAVSIDRVSFLSSVTTTYQQWAITTMDVSVNGGPFVSPNALSVRPGATLRVRVKMRPYSSTAADKTSLFTMTVPANAAGRSGSLVVTGGVNLGTDLYEPEGSLDGLLDKISSTPRNDEVVARLVLEGGSSPLTRTATNRHSQTVTGQRELAVRVG